MCTSDKRLTGLSEEERKVVIADLRSFVVWEKQVRQKTGIAAAYEYLAELVESAGREGE